MLNYSDDPARVVIDLTGSHIWDASTVAARDVIETKYEGCGTGAEFTGMNDPTGQFHARLIRQLGA